MRGVRLGRGFRGRMRLRVTIALALLLLLVLCGWMVVRSRRLEASSANTIEVYMDEMLAGRVDTGWLSKLTSVQVEIRGEMITCVSLLDTLQSMDARPTIRESVRIEGEGGSVSVPAREILPQWSAYIVYEVGGAPLSPENGGPYRIMVLKSDGAYISVDNVRKITVQLME